VQRPRPKLSQQENWLLHHHNSPSHTSVFIREFLTRNNKAVIPNPPYFSLIPWWKIKIKAAILTRDVI
jgi:hypothetical protein